METRHLPSERLIGRLVQRGIPRKEAEECAQDLADAQNETEAEFSDADTELARVFAKPGNS